MCQNRNGVTGEQVGPESCSSGGAVRRLKGLHRNDVQRGVVVATPQERADRPTVAQKAEVVHVHELERLILGTRSRFVGAHNDERDRAHGVLPHSALPGGSATAWRRCTQQRQAS
ncbi:hypothetical protein TcCL_NonESM10595 [Trypanosoma cruzi]|nr:hypothetical protein TcCL_NonESM10595 [Trypanosoma cruzi]